MGGGGNYEEWGWMELCHSWLVVLVTKKHQTAQSEKNFELKKNLVLQHLGVFPKCVSHDEMGFIENPPATPLQIIINKLKHSGDRTDNLLRLRRGGSHARVAATPRGCSDSAFCLFATSFGRCRVTSHISTNQPGALSRVVDLESSVTGIVPKVCRRITSS